MSSPAQHLWRRLLAACFTRNAPLAGLDTHSRARASWALAPTLFFLASVAVLAQFPWSGERARREDPSMRFEGNTPYDGRVVFVRLRYESGLSEFGFRRGRGGPGWFHDYPRADVHLMKIVQELTLIAPRTDGSNILSLDDPELFTFPIAYMSEPGGWQPSDKEVEGLRAYLQKGGFVIFDDFRGYDWINLETQMKRVMPEGRFIELDGTHPIFHSFFEIDSPSAFVPPYGEEPPVFYGMFDGNDPTKRMMAIANHNNDLGEYWEFSDTGWMPIDLSNEAYKFGVNYIVYGMTH